MKAKYAQQTEIQQKMNEMKTRIEASKKQAALCEDVVLIICFYCE